MRSLVAAVASLLTMLAFDAPWLYFAGGLLYKPNLPGLLLDKPLMGAAVAFYLVYVFGILQLAVAPGWHEDSPMPTIIRAAILGFVAYSTYDLTNLATLKGWSVTVTVVDMCWGTFLTAVAAIAGRTAARLWAGS